MITDFLCKILPTAPKYNPASEKINSELPRLKYDEIENLLLNVPLEKTNLSLSAVQQYRQLTTLFPGSKFIGYVPPVSPWKLAAMSKEKLAVYLDSLFRVSRFISPFYDFSIPSKITANKSNTYDGSHYSIQTNTMIADCMNNKSQDFGIRIDQMTREAYFNFFLRSLFDFISQQSPSNERV